jgi:hypothetical protein
MSRTRRDWSVNTFIGFMSGSKDVLGISAYQVTAHLILTLRSSTQRFPMSSIIRIHTCFLLRRDSFSPQPTCLPVH